MCVQVSGFDAELLEKAHALPAAPGSTQVAIAMGAIGIMVQPCAKLTTALLCQRFLSVRIWMVNQCHGGGSFARKHAGMP